MWDVPTLSPPMRLSSLLGGRQPDPPVKGKKQVPGGNDVEGAQERDTRTERGRVRGSAF